MLLPQLAVIISSPTKSTETTSHPCHVPQGDALPGITGGEMALWESVEFLRSEVCSHGLPIDDPSCCSTIGACLTTSCSPRPHLHAIHLNQHASASLCCEGHSLLSGQLNDLKQLITATAPSQVGAFSIFMSQLRTAFLDMPHKNLVYIDPLSPSNIVSEQAIL